MRKMCSQAQICKHLQTYTTGKKVWNIFSKLKFDDLTHNVTGDFYFPEIIVTEYQIVVLNYHCFYKSFVEH